MSVLGGYVPPQVERGLLQPEHAQEALRCERCEAWWVPDAGSFGCPVCAAQEEGQQGL